MNTPICDFVENYMKKNPLRLHMPGHKGKNGCERDITEVAGADSLYQANGIIRQSEENAASLFGAHTFYSTEGSSLSIRAMLCLFSLYCKEKGRTPRILAGRNAHKAFVSAAALLDLEVAWLYPEGAANYLSCPISPGILSNVLDDSQAAAVYVTSPDYLGNMADIAGLARVCHERGVLLFVDNAHGAYLRFLTPSRHPMDLGADLCTDSAHKTLPVLTGGAYLHISKTAPAFFRENARTALALFGSTSPSYLILQSLDKINPYLSEGYASSLGTFIARVSDLRQTLSNHGYIFVGDEPLKLTIDAKKYGYRGEAFSRLLEENNIVCEFADPDFVVLMLTTEIGTEGLKTLQNALLSIPQKAAILEGSPALYRPEKVLSIREAVLSPSKVVSVAESEGEILASVTVGCPPAVPILISGERISKETIKAFDYYNIKTCSIVKGL